MKNARYLLYFLLLYLLARGEILDGIRAFDTGLFFGLIYAGENLFVIAPIFILAHFLANPSINSLLITIPAVSLLAGLYILCFRLRRRVSVLEVNAVALLSRLPFILINISDTQLLTDNLIALFIAQLFVYICVICLYAIIKRGYNNKMTQDEIAAEGFIILALASAIYSVNLWGFQPIFLFAALVTVLIIYNLGSQGVLISSLIGIGVAFASNNLALAATFPLIAMCALMFKRMPLAFIAGGYILADVGLGFYFNPYGAYDILHIVAVSVGLIMVLLIPPNIHNQIKIQLKNIKDNLASRAIINMSRYEISSEIASLGKAFDDIGVALKNDLSELPTPYEVIDAIKCELVRDVCGSCDRRKDCYSDENGDIADLFRSIIKGALDKGRATLIDVPPLLTSICKKISVLTQSSTEMVNAYRDRADNINNIDKAKVLLAEQSQGIARLMSNLSKKTGKSITTDNIYEERIIEDLAYRGVVCSEVLLCNNGERGITLVVRHTDSNKKIIDKILHKNTGIHWLRSDVKCEYSNGLTALTLYPTPQYDVLTGECMSTKSGSIISGDTRSITRVGRDKVMIALCDGMGSGEQAEKDSSAAIAMIENLYLAGFDSETILSLVNNLLSSSNNERFNALDIAIIDIESGYTDFIKMGAVNGYIRCDNGVEVIEGGSLPLGIVDEMKPIVKRRKLLTSELCLIISDGVQDTIGIEHIDRILINNSTLNPEIISSEIVKACLKRGLKDDITAIAFRIYRKI